MSQPLQPSITLIIADDHEVVRQGVRAYLSAQPDLEVIGEAGSGEEAVRLAAELVPDVALLDLLMPGMDGIEATRRLKKVSPRTQVVVLTSYHEDEHIFPALRAGAISYLLKDIKMEEMAEAVRRAARGEATLHPRVAARVIQEIYGANRDTINPFTELTERELEVLRLIATGQSNSEIAAQMVVSENTVKGHVSNILSKLHLADRTQAAVFAWKEGIVRK
jgi:two-component system, NarL family, response regulator LiaR